MGTIAVFPLFLIEREKPELILAGGRWTFES